MTTKRNPEFVKTMERDVLEAQTGRTIWEHAGDHYTRTRDGQAWKWSRVFGKYMAINDPKPSAGKSIIAHRTRRIPQPLDWDENEARYQESQASHADDANEHRNEAHS